MNIESEQEFNRIVGMEPEALTDSDKAFLNARRDYLSAGQAEKFASVLISDEPKKARKTSKTDEE